MDGRDSEHQDTRDDDAAHTYKTPELGQKVTLANHNHGTGADCGSETYAVLSISRDGRAPAGTGLHDVSDGGHGADTHRVQHRARQFWRDGSPARGTVAMVRFTLASCLAIHAAVAVVPVAAADPVPLRIAARAKGHAVVATLTNQSKHRLCLLLSFGEDEMGIRRSAIDLYFGNEATHSFPSRRKPSHRCLAAKEELVLLSNRFDGCSDEATLVTAIYTTEENEEGARRACPECWIGSAESGPVTLPPDPCSR